MPKINTILFDLNGVLIVNTPNYEPEELEEKIYKRLGTAKDDSKEMEALLKELGWDKKKFWENDKSAWHRVKPNIELIEKIIFLKEKGYKVGLVTNTSGIVLRRHEKEFFGFRLDSLFDTVVVSSEVHMLKPDRDIYQLTLDRIGSTADDTLFIDDSKRYLEGAKEIGIRTLLYTDNNRLFMDLRNLEVTT